MFRFRFQKIFIRRCLTILMFSVWWLLTVFAGMKYLKLIELPEGFNDFYRVFSGAITIMIAFYYTGKPEQIEAD